MRPLASAGPKLSFHSAASQARSNASSSYESSAPVASFTISRNVEQQQQQQVVRPQLTSTGRSLTLRGGEPMQATPRGFLIQTTADDGREVRRPQQQQKKRHSGHLESSAADSASSNHSSSIVGRSLGRVTVVNESAMMDEHAGFDSANSSSSASFSKRSRITITNGSPAASSSAPAAGFAMWNSDVNTQAFLSSFMPAGPLPVAAPMPGLVKFNAGLVDSVARARNERLQAQQLATNAGARQGSPFGASASPPPPPAAAAASSAASSSAASSRPSAPAGTTVVLLRNLAPSVSAKFILTHLFGLFDVRTINVDTDAATGNCSGTAEAYFLRQQDAEEAVALGQGQMMLGQPVRLSIVQANQTEAMPEPMQVQQQTQQARQPQQQQPQQQQRAASSVSASSVSSSGPAPASSQSSSGVSGGVSFSYIYLPSYARRPTPTGSASIDPANPGSVFSNQLTNLGFVFDELTAAAAAAGADGTDTVFNITNRRGAHVPAASASSSESSGPLVLSSGVVKAKTLQLALKPKPTAAGAAAAADLAPQATTAGRQLKLAPKASRQQQPLSSVVAPAERQPKSVVLAPAKR